LADGEWSAYGRREHRRVFGIRSGTEGGSRFRRESVDPGDTEGSHFQHVYRGTGIDRSTKRSVGATYATSGIGDSTTRGEVQGEFSMEALSGYASQ